MQISLPTDNLYKFYSLFGLSIVVFFSGLLALQYRSVNDAIHQANLTAANAYVEISRLEVFLEEKDPFISESVRAGTIKPTKHIIPGKYPERLLEIVFYVPIEVAEEKIKTSVSKINDILEKQAFAHIEAKFALENAEKLTNDLHKLMAIAVVFILAGAYQYVHGFRLWLLRTQMPIDGKSKETTNA